MPSDLHERLIERAHQAQRLEADPQDPPKRPDTLYHFTDAAGVAGILAERGIWASHARSLSDPSEVAYGLHLAADHLMAPDGPVERKLFKLTGACLEGTSSEREWNVSFELFVAAFCTSAEGVLHWLHYGRSGKGYALGFPSDSLAAEPFALQRVEYDRSRQERLVRLTVNLFSSILDSNPSDGSFQAAAVMCAGALRALAGRLKDPRFALEDEWRMITFARLDADARPDAPPQPALRYRDVAGRVVPFVVARIEPFGIRRVVLGFSASQMETDFRIALRADCPDTEVVRSSLPLR